jgi:hypothetical protein
MGKASWLAFVLIASLGAPRYSRAQDVHIHIPPAAPQAQDLHTPIPQATVPGPETINPPVPEGDDIQRQQATAANLQRQVEIRRDTEKMLQLAVELKDYLEKAERGVMSVDAIKKAEQIEKLAHGVKSKMKISF